MSERNGHTPFDRSRLWDLASQHVDDRLAAYTGGECTELERLAVERHLATCPACRAALGETQRIRVLLASLASQVAPASVADGVLARLAVSAEPISAEDGPIGDGSDETPIGEIDTPDDVSQSTGCPVSLVGDVPLLSARRGPRRPHSPQLSPWQHREGALERDGTTMERDPSRASRASTRPERLAREHSMYGPSAHGGRLRSFAAVAAAVVLIALGAGIFGVMSQRVAPGRSHLGGQPSATVTTPGQPSKTVSTDLPANSTLDAISMDSPTDGWAVGTVYNASNGMGGSKNVLLAHYDGHSWSASPDGANFKLGYLVGISMDSADDGWAVGSIQDTPVAPMRGLLLHYSGGHWRAVDVSNTGFAGGGELQMVSADEGWLYAQVGAKLSNGQLNPDHKTLVIHYHNGTWQLFSSVLGYDRVSMLSASDGWAANTETHSILHYQNGAWTQVATAIGLPLNLLMVTPSEGWISGSARNGQSVFAMHYDGHSWTQMALPGAAYAEIGQIAAAAPSDIWMFGRVNTNTTAPQTVAWHYLAGQWTQVNLDFQAYPTGASMASPASGWVTGNAAFNSAALMRYDQGTWTAVYYGK